LPAEALNIFLENFDVYYLLQLVFEYSVSFLIVASVLLRLFDWNV